MSSELIVSLLVALALVDCAMMTLYKRTSAETEMKKTIVIVAAIFGNDSRYVCRLLSEL
jgi:hypothetical protein